MGPGAPIPLAATLAGVVGHAAFQHGFGRIKVCLNRFTADAALEANGVLGAALLYGMGGVKFVAGIVENHEAADLAFFDVMAGMLQVTFGPLVLLGWGYQRGAADFAGGVAFTIQAVATFGQVGGDRNVANNFTKKFAHPGRPLFESGWWEWIELPISVAAAFFFFNLLAAQLALVGDLVRLVMDGVIDHFLAVDLLILVVLFHDPLVAAAGANFDLLATNLPGFAVFVPGCSGIPPTAAQADPVFAATLQDRLFGDLVFGPQAAAAAAFGAGIIHFAGSPKLSPQTVIVIGLQFTLIATILTLFDPLTRVGRGTFDPNVFGMTGIQDGAADATIGDRAAGVAGAGFEVIFKVRRMTEDFAKEIHDGSGLNGLQKR